MHKVGGVTAPGAFGSTHTTLLSGIRVVINLFVLVEKIDVEGQK